jgi:4-azaleucine resistance transporter AzlC
MRDFQRGLLATLPLAPGVVAFGLLYGVMARQVGFSPWEAWAMSLIVHAGSAQFTALGMWEATGTIPIILTTLVINLRHLLMGASMAPHLRRVQPLWKALLALWMSDESYALAVAEYERGRGSHQYFLGANVGIYLAWTISGPVGAFLCQLGLPWFLEGKKKETQLGPEPARTSKGYSFQKKCHAPRRCVAFYTLVLL